MIGRQTFQSERAAAILVFLETSYRIQIDLLTASIDARRRIERSMLSDMILRISDPQICRLVYQDGLTHMTRLEIIRNLNALQAISSRPTRRVFREVAQSALQNMRRAYTDLANSISGSG